MSNGLKAGIQNFMTKRCMKEYRAALEEQTNVYDTFMSKQEEKLRKEYESRSCVLTGKVVTKQELPGLMKEKSEVKEDVLIVVHKEGFLSPIASKVILSYFDENRKCGLLYADEDICIGTEKDFERFQRGRINLSSRCYPNLKPVPSWETFLSYQYFGNVWAIRCDLLKEITPEETEDAEVLEYDLLLKAWGSVGTEGVAHVPQILYHKFEPVRSDENGNALNREEMERLFREEDKIIGATEKFNHIKELAGKQQGLRFTMVTEGGYSYPVYEAEEEKNKVSILIPSKDNPQVLYKCIESIYERSTYRNFEIIVIDNGSSREHRDEIEEMRNKYPFHYVYAPMKFNYSVMNNTAAEEATGEIILLLNDDMEVVTPDWLDRMVGQLLQEGVGAVGAKLLYPNSTLIQHVGITNAVDGPVHKLLKKDDRQSYNRGRNKLVYNVIGVTGACLMVKSDVYREQRGLRELLRVAYNDVDLCFALYEKGLRNVVRNDVILYHHESLSRGADVMSQEKMKRLKWERDRLYEAHPELAYKDPYEGANNRGGEDFGLQMRIDYNAKKDAFETAKKAKRDYRKYPAGVYVGIDRVGKETGSTANGKQVYAVTGFTILPEVDNCRYTFEMVFSGEKETYYMPIRKKMRTNMSGGFPNAKNLDLCGFYCWVTTEELPEGAYEVGIFAKDRCSRQRLFQETGEILVVE